MGYQTRNLAKHRTSSLDDRATRVTVPAEDYAASRSDSDFDTAGWLALLTEQRLRIARVAGVDPSKVSIKVGH